MKVIITAGGTGGHIYPALGVVEKLMLERDNEILYIGTKNRMESKIVPSLGINYKSLEIYGLSKNILKNVKNMKCIMASYKECKRIIKEFKPDYVIGFGGYVTFPVLMAAHKYKIRTGIHEQNMLPGKTNKILSKFTDTTFISFSGSEKEFRNKVILTGNPCGEKAINTCGHDKTKLGFTKNKKLILIVMGSLGSEIINDKLREFLETFDNETMEILLITGEASYKEFKDLNLPKSVKVLSYYDNLSGLMKSCDIIISRAGASTISEILALEKPSILIPSPYVANNHQYYNALDLSDRGVSIMLEQKDLTTESLKKSIEKVVKNEKEIKKKLSELPKLKASTLIVEEMKRLDI